MIEYDGPAIPVTITMDDYQEDPGLYLFAPRGAYGQYPSIADRIDETGSCWLWTGQKNTNGYGQPKVNGRGVLIHRLMYEALVGPIPDGLGLDHLCRVPTCCNPDHLEPVTGRENTRRSPVANAAKNARKTHCPKKHPLAGENLYVGPDGKRHCRVCGRAARRAYKQRKEQERAT